MDFFKNKTVKLVCWVLLAVSIIGLILGGVTKEAIDGFTVLVCAMVSAISAVIIYIIEHVNKEDK